MSHHNVQAWDLPAPVRRPDETSSQAVLMPPLPPPNNLSIFDDVGDVGHGGNANSRNAEDNSDEENEVRGGLIYKKKKALHPDDVWHGEATEDLLPTSERSESFYLVYSPRSKLVKIGITLLSYEECREKFTKLYGNLEAFHFLKIENDMTRDRLERAVYQFFSETRMFSGRELFKPEDSRGRPMVPIYHTLLTLLTSSDIRSIQRFYLQHGTTALAARQWIEDQHLQRGGPGAVAPVNSEEAAELKNKRILTHAAVEALSRSEQFLTRTGNAPDSEPELESSDSEGSGDEATEKPSPNASADADRRLAPEGEPVSLYLVHSARGDLVKVGFTTTSYEACREKYGKVYGHIDTFHFLEVENDLLCYRRTRLEKLFYRLFADTRVTPRREFFRPNDSRGRDMVPLYYAVLRIISSPNVATVKRWCAKHSTPAAMQRWIEDQHRQQQAEPVPALASTETASGKLRGAPLVTVFGLATPTPAADSPLAARSGNPESAVRTFLDSPMKAPTPTAVPVTTVGGVLPPPLPATSTATAGSSAPSSGGSMQHMELELQDMP